MRIVPKSLILAFVLALALTSVAAAAGISETAAPEFNGTVPAEWMARQTPATQCAATFQDLANAKTPSSTASFCSFACTVGCVASGYFGGYCVSGSCHCNGADR